MKHQIHIQLLREGACLPTYGSADAAGADLYACLPGPVSIAPGETVRIPTGLAMEIPAGWAGLVFARSGLSCKQGLAPANKVGVVDSDYRGEVMVFLHNHGPLERTVAPGDRIAQLVLVPCPQADFLPVDDLSDTARGGGGFGSTGA